MWKYKPVIFLTNLTLRKKILLLTVVGLVLGVAIFSFLGIRAVEQATETMLQERLTMAGLISDYIDETLQRTLSELKSTAQTIEINGTPENFEHQIENLKNTYSRLSIHISSVYLLSEEGQIIWSQPEAQETMSINISSYPSLMRTITKDETSISGVISVPLTEDPVVLLSSTTNKGQQGSKGIFIVAIDLDKSSIGGFISPIRLGKTGYVEIVDQSGIVAARTDPGPVLFPFERSDHSERFARLIAIGEPTRGVCHTCHEIEQEVKKRDVLAFVPLSITGWGVVIRQAEEESLAPIHKLQQNLLLFGIGFVIISLLFVVITTRDVISRIKVLTTASQRIAGGDLIRPVTTLGKDEIGVLAGTFDNMRAKLRASHEESKQLYQDLQHKDEIRRELLRDLLSVQEEERKRIARELHDETSQVLAGQSANLEVAMSMLPADTDELKAILKKTQNQSINILEDIHRLIYELRPSVLDDLGLVTAVQWLAENILEKEGVEVNFKTIGRVKKFDIQFETVLFRVIQEMLNNISKHSDAKFVYICLHFKKISIEVHVTDDGIGFDVEEAMSTKNRPRGLGLLGMKERLEIVRGSLRIKSHSGGGGTEIDINIPLN